MTVKERVEIPGAILEPGEYVVKLVDSQANRHIVRFMNAEEDEVISTVIAIPNVRLEPTGETEFGWYETPAGQPPALRAWFYPGDTFGQEFAYPEDRATELSAATSQQVPSISDEEAATAANQQETVVAQTPAPRTTPQATDQTAQRDREREMAAQRERELQAQQERDREMAAQRERDAQAQRDREREIAQAQDQQRDADQSLTAQQQTPQSQTEGELPATAGLGALLALIGLGALGASRAVHKLRNK